MTTRSAAVAAASAPVPTAGAGMTTTSQTGNSSSGASSATPASGGNSRTKTEHLSPEKLKQFYDMMLEYELTEKNARALLTGIDPSYFARADFESQLRPKLELFRSCGLVGPSLARSLHAFQKILWLDTDGLQRRADYLRSEFKLTTEDLSRILMLNPSVLAMNEQKLRQKVQYLCQELSITETECMKMAVHFPPVFNYQIEGNIRPKIDFLMNELKLSRADVTRVLFGFPQLFGLHIRRGIQQKWEVLQYFVEDLCNTPPGTARKMVTSHIRYFSYSLRRRLLPRFAYLSMLGPVIQIHPEVPASIGASRPSALLSSPAAKSSSQDPEEGQEQEARKKQLTAMQRLLEATPEQFDYSLRRRKQIEVEERARRARALAFYHSAMASVNRILAGGSIKEEIHKLLPAFVPSSQQRAKAALRLALKKAIEATTSPVGLAAHTDLDSTSDLTLSSAAALAIPEPLDSQQPRGPSPATLKKKRKTRPRYPETAPESSQFYKLIWFDFEPAPVIFESEQDRIIAQELASRVPPDRKPSRPRVDESVLESVQRRADSEGLISPIIGSLSPLLSPSNASFMQRLPFALFRLVPRLAHTVPPPNEPIRPEHFKEFLSAWMRECRKIVNGTWGFPDGKFAHNYFNPPSAKMSAPNTPSSASAADASLKTSSYEDYDQPRQGRRRPKPAMSTDATTGDTDSARRDVDDESDLELVAEDDDSDTDLVRAEDLVTLFFDMRSQVELASAQEKDLSGVMGSPAVKQLATALKQMDAMIDSKDAQTQTRVIQETTKVNLKSPMDGSPKPVQAVTRTKTAAPVFHGQGTSLVAIAMLMLQHQRKAFERERERQRLAELGEAKEAARPDNISSEESGSGILYDHQSILQRMLASTKTTSSGAPSRAIDRPAPIAPAEKSATISDSLVEAAALAAANAAAQPRGRVRSVEVELQTNLYGTASARHKVCVTGIPEGLNLNELAMLDADANEVRMPTPPDSEQHDERTGEPGSRVSDNELQTNEDSTDSSKREETTQHSTPDGVQYVEHFAPQVSAYDLMDTWLEQLGMAVLVTEAKSTDQAATDGRKVKPRGQAGAKPSTPE